MNEAPNGCALRAKAHFRLLHGGQGFPDLGNAITSKEVRLPRHRIFRKSKA